jgi:hypothetical protein
MSDDESPSPISPGLVPFDLTLPTRSFIPHYMTKAEREAWAADEPRREAERLREEAESLAAKRAADGLCHVLDNSVECVDCGAEAYECDLPVNHDGDHAETVRWRDRG